MLRNDGIMGLFVGVSRSGKSTPIKLMVKKAKRVIVWDSKNEYGPCGVRVIRSLPALLNVLQKTKGNAKIAYVPSGFTRNEFDAFCRLAHLWNKLKPCLIVIEELAAVTNACKAVGYWGVLVNQSLGLGATLVATVQRGQEVDKSMMNNSSYLYICQHTTDDDAKYMAKKIGVPVSIIPRIPMRFIIWTPAKGLAMQGKTEYRKNGKRVTKVVPGASPVFMPLGDKRKRLILNATTGLFSNVRYR